MTYSIITKLYLLLWIMCTCNRTSMTYQLGRLQICCHSTSCSKCEFMLVSHKRHPSFPSLSLHCVPIDRVTSYKYLGVLLSSDLSWSPHVERQCASGKRLLGLLYRQFSKHITDPSVLSRLFCSPHLEYAAQVWNPYLVSRTESETNSLTIL